MSIPMLVWLILAVVFLIVEGLTVALVSVWFAIGAAAAFITSVFTDSMLIQAAVFLAVSCAVLAALRPWAMRRVQPRHVATNAGANVGKTAQVIEAVTPAQGGRVRLDGVDWAARCAVPLEKGELCRVTAVDGATLAVEPMDARRV